MSTRSTKTASFRNTRLMLVSAAALVGLTGCPEDDSNTAKIEDIVGVGASGTFTRQSGTLSVSVSPKDDKGNFVGQNLPRSAFSFENVQMIPEGQAATRSIAITTEVSNVSVSEPDPNAKLTGVVVFDSSGSMATNDPMAVGRKKGGEAMFDILRAGDEVAVLDFGAGTTAPLKVSRVLQDFTGDRALLSASLAKLTQSGGTPLYQSIQDGLTLLDPAKNPNIDEPALVVLTDGQADSSGLLEATIKEAQRLTVPVFAIGLGKSLDLSDLARLSSETGGVMVEASDAMALEKAFAGVSSGVRLGSVTVEGKGTYMLPTGVTRFRVMGTLVTVDMTGARFMTPFQFTVEIF